VRASRSHLFVLALSGVVLAWCGGYLLSSQDSKCVDGPGGHVCSGTFSSEGWHVVGAVSVSLGLTMVLAALAMMAFAFRRLHSHQD